jgi:hypothetical protein
LNTCFNPAGFDAQNQRYRLQCSGALQELMVISMVILSNSHVLAFYWSGVKKLTKNFELFYQGACL